MLPKILTSCDNEAEDADIVDKASNAIDEHDLEYAETLLLGVIKNTPDNYLNSEEFNDIIYVKFWGKDDLYHYVNWQIEQGSNDKIIEWLGNAYPRAYYLLGYIYTEYRVFDRAIEFFNKGLILEPTNPKLINEKALALTFLDKKNQALSLYQLNTKVGPFVNDLDAAKALRGKGSVYIELGDLVAAKEAYILSLKIEPYNNNALNELNYIDHILHGGDASEPEIIESLPNKMRSIIKKLF